MPESAAMTGAGVAGAAGTSQLASSDGAKAITSGPGTGDSAVSPGRSARNGDSAGTTPVAAAVLRGASALGLASCTIASAVRPEAGTGGTDRVSAGPPETCCSTHACGNGSAAGATADFAPVSCAGTSTRRRSGTSIRRSSQGKRKPGRPVPWPPKTRLNSSVWMSSESSSACDSRLRSGLMRRLSRGPRPAACGEPTRVGSAGRVGASQEPVQSRMLCGRRSRLPRHTLIGRVCQLRREPSRQGTGANVRYHARIQLVDATHLAALRVKECCR